MFLYLAIFLITVLILSFWVIKRMKINSQYRRAADFKIFLVKVPREVKLKEGEAPKSFVEFLAVAEQLFASLHSLYKSDFKTKIIGGEHISFEITTFEKEIGFYFAAPREIAQTIERQIHSFYPYAQIEEVLDHHTFHYSRPGYLAAATLKQDKADVFPLRTYRILEADPLNSLLGILAKLEPAESAAIQILIRPESNEWRLRAQKQMKNIQEGKSPSGGGKFLKTAGKVAADLGRAAAAKGGESNEEKQKASPLTPLQEETLKRLEEKSSKVAFRSQIRIISASPVKERAEFNLHNLGSAFADFNSTEGNSLSAIEYKDLDKIIKYYIFRIFDPKNKGLLLNTEELASIYHFPNQFIDAPNIIYLSAKDAPAPVNLPEEGTILGMAIYRGMEKPVYIKDDDRRRHIYAIGKTGTGKTTMMEGMVMSDIKRGNGLCLIDPHGDLSESIIRKIPKNRAEDLILFDPALTEKPLGFNLLEAKTKKERDFLVQETVSIFYKLFDPTRQGFIGPQFAHWLRNAALTLMEQPEGGTLIEIPRLFTDKEFERRSVANIKDNIVKSFWTKQMAQTAEFHKSEMLNYFTSKFGRFMTNEMIRNIIGQRKSAFDIRQIMDKGKILVCNLSKGKMGEVNSNLIGMILVSKLQMAAMSRAEIPEKDRRDFYLYVDEFQNFATDSFAEILSEARKYHLNLTIANQYVAQLEEKIRDAVFGNIGTFISFRIGAGEAEYIQKEFEPVFDENDLINIDKYHAYIRLLIDGVPARPFSMKTVLESSPGSERIARALTNLALLKYGRDYRIVEAEIEERVKETAYGPTPKIEDTTERGV